MKRTMCWVMSFAGVAALLAAGACGGSDDDDDSNTTTTATGTGTGTGTGSGGGTPSCYRCADYTLACAAPSGCPAGDPFDLVCESSMPLMVALNQCICSPTGGDCQADCAGTCALSAGGTGGAAAGGAGGAGGAAAGGMDSGQGGDSPDCMTCQAGAIQADCLDAWNACLDDSST